MADGGNVLDTARASQLLPDHLRAHLFSAHGIDVVSSVTLDLNVYRIEARIKKGEEASSPTATLVLRLFERPLADLENEVSLLDYLLEQGFPAELPFTAEPCSQLLPVSGSASTECIFLTHFIPGARPERSRETFHRLGTLLGRLHALPIPQGLRRGGGWHHLSSTGDIDAECAAANHGLEDLKSRTSPDVQASTTRLQAALAALSALWESELPTAPVHPDVMPSNIIQSPSAAPDAPANPAAWTLVDWAGAGRGIRLLPLGFALHAAGANLRSRGALVDALMRGYRAHVSLSPRELELLPLATYARPLTIACWEVCRGRKGVETVLAGLPDWVEKAEWVAERVRKGLR